MKSSLLNLLYTSVFAITITTTVVRASDVFVHDIFSHAVLNLPFEFRSTEPWVRFISTQEEWESFYTELIYGNLGNTEFLLPEIDFENYQMIAGGVGFQSTGGFQLVIEKVYENSNGLFVDILFVTPGKYCGVTTASSYPSAAILIKKTDKPSKISVTNIVKECPF